MPFEKNNNANPAGRRKGVPNKRTELMAAIKYVQDTKGKDGKKRKKLLVHAIEQCYVDNRLLAAVLKKFIPDMKHLDVENAGNLIIEIVNYSKKTNA